MTIKKRLQLYKRFFETIKERKRYIMQNNILILKNAKRNPHANPNAWRSFSDLANTLTCEYGNNLENAIKNKQVQIWQFSGKYQATRSI